jgi:hypothetical protein
MLVIVDESGDPSFSLNSSEYFSITAVIFDNLKKAEEVSKFVRKFKDKHKLKPELKYSKMKKEINAKFFLNLDLYKSFHVINYSIAKRSIKDLKLRKEPKKLYFYVLTKLLAEIQFLGNPVSSFKIDKMNDKNFRANISKIINLDFKNAKIHFVSSQSDNLVQVADMYSGLINSKLKTKEIKSGVYKSPV